MGLELLEQARGKGIAQFFERLGRQFFHKEFNQQILCRHVFVYGVRGLKMDFARCGRRVVQCGGNRVRYSGRLLAMTLKLPTMWAKSAGCKP